MSMSPRSLEIQDSYSISSCQGPTDPSPKLIPGLLEVEVEAQLTAQCAPIVLVKLLSAPPAKPVLTVRGSSIHLPRGFQNPCVPPPCKT